MVPKIQYIRLNLKKKKQQQQQQKQHYLLSKRCVFLKFIYFCILLQDFPPEVHVVRANVISSHNNLTLLFTDDLKQCSKHVL